MAANARYPWTPELEHKLRDAIDKCTPRPTRGTQVPVAVRKQLAEITEIKEKMGERSESAIKSVIVAALDRILGFKNPNAPAAAGAKRKGGEVDKEEDCVDDGIVRCKRLLRRHQRKSRRQRSAGRPPPRRTRWCSGRWCTPSAP